MHTLSSLILRVSLAGALVCLAGARPALAQEDAEIPPAVLAEQDRLQNEMQKLASREAWEGVEALYKRLQALESEGAELTYAEHLLGAQAARSLGDVASTRQRLGWALEQWDTELARDWLDDIDRNYGRVSLRIPSRQKGAVTLDIATMPFEADRRYAIEHAQEALDETGVFEGFLPKGTYNLGERQFVVVSGGTSATVNLDGGGRASPEPEPEPDASAEVEPPLEEEDPPPSGGLGWSARLRLGGGAGVVGAPRRAGVEPIGFSGFSPGAALGVGLVSGDRYRLLGEAGVWSASQGTESLQMFSGGLMLGAKLGPMWLEAGPVYAAGSGEMIGLDQAALDTYCAEDPAAECDFYSRERIAEVETAGTVRAGGAALGAAVLLAEAGPVGFLLGGDVGLLSDGARSLSWARLSLSVQLSGGGS